MYQRRKTNRQLIDRLRETANLSTFSAGFGLRQQPDESGDDFARRITRLYRESWMNPILDEIERRLIRPKKASQP